MSTARLVRRAGTPVAVVALATTVTACDRIDDFDTGPGEAYCGEITLASAYRAGFTPRVQMRMTFDSSKVDAGESPGMVTTFDAGMESEPQLLTDAPLRPIPALSHDPLAQLEFGDGREVNLIYAITPNSPDAESVLAVLSLRTDEAVEVRLIRPGIEAGEGDVPSGRKPLFGLFLLHRRDGDCGF